ncbi:MAG: AAA family ATPase [Deltaproteobacteria bacterium]|nr:AAA family ATPase [Deltaproteobacteria bacterium]
MKLAISGKGGVGKTTFAALLIKALNDMGKRILAIDADPDANLAVALDVSDPESVVPIADMKDLIRERTGADPETVGAFFKLNPKVDDLPERCSMDIDRIKFMRLGGVKKGGGGCICPSSTLLRALVSHILLARDEVVVMDMEAGIEHLARGTASAVDKLIVVVEPGRRSVETARHIKKLASEIGLRRVFLLGNKIRNPQDREFLEKYVTEFEWLGFLPYDDTIIRCDLEGRSPYSVDTLAKDRVRALAEALLQHDGNPARPYPAENEQVHTHEHRHGARVHTHRHAHRHTHVSKPSPSGPRHGHDHDHG